ncbi:MAG: glycosyl transferase [Paludibacteraceae bacterium]|nr:glycosyl transferase [Paludibacteraceae bacterium]
MIPKIIHYCWFGGAQMPELARNCIESWRKFLPDYELRLWNEQTFDINSVPYVKEAYEARKFAFMTDYVRLWALNKYGGIYMDTDVEVLCSLDDLLALPAFTGYEASMSNAPVTGLMASEAGGIWVREQLAYYDNRHFLQPDGSLDMTTNTVTIARIMKENGFVIDGKYRVYKDNMHVFPVDWFCPLTSTRVLKLTKNTRCIHHFAGSWRERTRGQIIKDWIVANILGRTLTDKLVQIKRKIVGKKK